MGVPKTVYFVIAASLFVTALQYRRLAHEADSAGQMMVAYSGYDQPLVWMTEKPKKIRISKPTKGCLGPPYIYMTFHADINNVRKYTRDGCDLGNVLVYNPDLSELRGMMLMKTGELLVLNAYKKDSAVLQYGSCDDDGHRRFEQVVFSRAAHNKAMEHPYGIALGPDGYIYVSSQDTFTVLRFQLDGSPGPRPKAIKKEDTSKKMAGAFVVFPAGEDVRGITFDEKGTLYVSNKVHGVMMFDRDGFQIGLIEVEKPIGLLYSTERESVFIGSTQGHHSQVLEYNVHDHTLKATYHAKGYLNHPAGMVVYKDTLYAVSQSDGTIIEFNLNKGKYKRTVNGDLPDIGEHLLLSMC